ncbi:MAG: hypothetical protein V3S01_09325 [Dehalococcoidia bacterium]
MIRAPHALLISILFMAGIIWASETIKGGPTESVGGVVGSPTGAGVVDVFQCQMAADQTNVSAGADIPIVWDYDTCTSSSLGKALWMTSEADSATMTVPAGVTYFHFNTLANQEGSAAIDRRRVWLKPLSGASFTIDGRWSPQTTYTTIASDITTAAYEYHIHGVDMAVGATFNLSQVQHSSGPLDIFASGTYMRIEAY